MQFGKTIIGALIGAAIGIALLVGVYLAFSIDSVWLALPVAILTGLGVRMMVATGGHASYLRGAITGALALAAYLIGCNVVGGYAQKTASTAAKATRAEQPAVVAEADPAAAGEDAPAAEEEAEAEAPTTKVDDGKRPAGLIVQNPTVNKGFSTLDFIVLCASGLIAYELGRGSAPKAAAVVGEETTTEVAVSQHPDA